MMKHLTRAELLDVVESRELPAARNRHLEQCRACRARADALRAVLARAADDRVPEPSPLFWEHFANRVSEAVRTESMAPDSTPWLGRLRRPLATWAVAAAAAVLVILTVVWRATLHAPTMPRVAQTVATPDGAPREVPALDNPDADERWAVVRAAAEDLAWEDVHDAGISARPGSTDGVVLELTADERLELARLLDHEMKRNGV